MSKIALSQFNGDTVAILNTVAPRTMLTVDCGHLWGYNTETGVCSCRCGTYYDTITGAWSAPGRPAAS